MEISESIINLGTRGTETILDYIKNSKFITASTTLNFVRTVRTVVMRGAKVFSRVLEDRQGFRVGAEVKVSACNVGDLVQSLAWEDPLGKEMATHFSMLAWRIPWTGEPGGLQSTGSQRVGHD